MSTRKQTAVDGDLQVANGWVSKSSQFFRQWTKGWLILAVLLVLVLFMAVTLPRLQAVSRGIEGLDTMFFYTPGEAYANLASHSAAGREVLLSFHLTADLVNPILYGLFLVLLVSWFFQRSFSRTSRLQNLNLIPLGAVIFDVSENVCIALMISALPRQIEALAWLSTVSTMLKLSFIYLSTALILLGAGAWVLSRAKARNSARGPAVEGK